jgi:hypothetical protein
VEEYNRLLVDQLFQVTGKRDVPDRKKSFDPNEWAGVERLVRVERPAVPILGNRGWNTPTIDIIGVADAGELLALVNIDNIVALVNPLGQHPDESGTWYHVRLLDGKEGWICAVPHGREASPFARAFRSERGALSSLTDVGSESSTNRAPRTGNRSSPRNGTLADKQGPSGRQASDAFGMIGLVGMGIGALVGLIYGLANKSPGKALLLAIAGGVAGFLAAILVLVLLAILVIALVLKALASAGSSGGSVIQQDGKTYRRNWLGQWVADKDWLGNDKVERDWLGQPKIKRDWLGNQKIERDWLGNPIVPPEKKSHSGGCLITTACTQAKRLPDDCLELRTLRRFRDSYVRNLPNGESVIREYYDVASKIVAAINAQDNAEEVYRDLYERLVLKSIALIRSGRNNEALENYVGVVAELKRRYACPSPKGHVQSL